MNYLDILVRASIDVAAAAENIKLPHAGTQVSPPRVQSKSLCLCPVQPEDMLLWGHATVALVSLRVVTPPPL